MRDPFGALLVLSTFAAIAGCSTPTCDSVHAPAGLWLKVGETGQLTYRIDADFEFEHADLAVRCPKAPMGVVTLFNGVGGCGSDEHKDSSLSIGWSVVKPGMEFVVDVRSTMKGWYEIVGVVRDTSTEDSRLSGPACTVSTTVRVAD